jgi:hypothetical protein
MKPLSSIVRRAAYASSGSSARLSSLLLFRSSARGFAAVPTGRNAGVSGGVASELERQINLKEDVSAHAENYFESGITDPKIITGEFKEDEDLLERLPEDLKAGAGLYEESGVSDPSEFEAPRQQQRAGMSFSGRSTTGNRAVIPNDLRRNPQKMAEFFSEEYANSSSSEEVVSVDRSADDPLADRSPANARNPDASSSELADAVRRKYGRAPSSHARPRGGADAIPQYYNEEGSERR